MASRNLWQEGRILAPGHEKSKHKELFQARICGRTVGYRLWDMRKQAKGDCGKPESVAGRQDIGSRT
ncbi:hypothetical protein [Butyrivibrio sp. FCS006]|uniref:hypothetical protein n=1 Tax=Butyrivibrio sp. FCS006 TaxID=1280684 RepID=UPI0012DFBD54|nr:hypothetical protein [Butyrivibrio sp. FCS006]